MSWKDKMKEFGGGDLSFLSEDGEAIMFIVVGDPVLLQGKYKGTPSEKIGCPICSQDGFALFVSGKRLARKLSKYEDRFGDTAFIAIRHGVQGDIEARYELKIVDDADQTARLFGLVQGKDFSVEITESIIAAQDVMRQ